jgi:peptidoglycan DL-endopeptidase CwlO
LLRSVSVSYALYKHASHHSLVAIIATLLCCQVIEGDEDMLSHMRRIRYPSGVTRDWTVRDLSNYEQVYEKWWQSQQAVANSSTKAAAKSSNSSSSSSASAQQSSGSSGTSDREKLCAKGGDGPSFDTTLSTVTATAAKAVVPAVNSSSSSSVVAQQSSSSSSSSASGRAKAKKQPGGAPLLKATAATGGAKANSSSLLYPRGASVHMHVNGVWVVATVSKHMILSVYACKHTTHLLRSVCMQAQYSLAVTTCYTAVLAGHLLLESAQRR